jgi:hypothetical protein
MLILPNNPMSMPNKVKKYFRVLEVSTSFNIVLNTEIRALRRFKKSHL